jgi:hypothetical protein
LNSRINFCSIIQTKPENFSLSINGLFGSIDYFMYIFIRQIRKATVVKRALTNTKIQTRYGLPVFAISFREKGN